MRTSPIRPGRSPRARAAARAATAAAALFLLVLAFAPSAGASVYWGTHFDSANVLGTTIGRAANDGTAVDQSFIGGAAAPTAVAVDAGHVYWVNDADHSIGRANLDGTGVNQRFITGLDRGPLGLAVDHAHIYWTNIVGFFPLNASDDAIGRANLDGTGVDQNFITGASFPRGVAVDGEHVYWTNLGDDTIGRANLDGTGVDQSFIDAGEFASPAGLALDGGHVYWADSANGTIARANLDGTGVDRSFIAGVPGPWGVAVDSAHLFWTSQLDSPDGVGGGAIGRANLDGTGVNQTLITGLGDVIGVAVDVAQRVDQPSRISLDDVTTTEGDAGQTAFRFTASLDTPQPVPVTVDFATSDGTATAPSDYAAGTGTLTFAPGETAKPLTVQVNGDTTVEPDETFNVNLTNATGNTTIADATGRGTIINDDHPVIAPPSRISLGDVRTSEGNAGQTAFRFTASLDAPQPAPVTVHFATADGTATAPSDYAANSGTLTFAPGATSETVTVQVNGDTRKETHETFSLDLSDVTGNGTLADAHAVGTIVNDDRKRASHGFMLGTAQPNLKTGTARLAVTVPGRGTLAISGSGAKAARAMRARSVRAAGTVRLLIRASGRKQRTLNRTGTVTITPRVTYTPTGGSPRTRSTNVRLQKR